MSNATFTVRLINGSAEDDANAATMIVTRENERRAALDPPGDALPLSPAAALKTSYETVLAATLLTAHASYIAQAARAAIDADTTRARWLASTNAQRQAALALLAPAP